MISAPTYNIDKMLAKFFIVCYHIIDISKNIVK